MHLIKYLSSAVKFFIRFFQKSDNFFFSSLLLMASRTITSCLKLKLFKKNNSILNNRTSIFPGSQAFLRQATTSSIFLDTMVSRPNHFQLFDKQSQKQDVFLVNFTSPEGKRLFRGAMIQGQAESFFKLVGNFSSQSSLTQGGVSSRK